jgi:2-succinyl-6-hydroxy-2,4-cyclohexadiene-1-carboxylate synthase
MATLLIRGAIHHYELTDPRADRPVLVFVHGWLLSRSYWQPLIALLSPYFQCLAYDLRGFGESGVGQQPDAEPYHPAAYAEDLGSLMAALELTSTWIVGHSLGGSIALWAAKLWPDQVQGVICLNAGGGIYIRNEFEQFRQAGQYMVKFRHPLLGRIPGLDRIIGQMGNVQPLAPAWRRQRLLDFLAAAPCAALGALLESTTEAEVHQLPQVVAQLAQPVYFLAGDRDTVMQPKYVQHLASYHGSFAGCGSNLIRLSDCGHMAMLEQTEVVAQTLIDCLDSARPIEQVA